MGKDKKKPQNNFQDTSKENRLGFAIDLEKHHNVFSAYKKCCRHQHEEKTNDFCQEKRKLHIPLLCLCVAYPSFREFASFSSYTKKHKSRTIILMPDTDLLNNIKEADLRYVTDNTPGITRKKENGNFSYVDTSGKKITSDIILERIKQLVIPPAWENVWICPSPTGYLQATGIDDRERKQYIYHKAWTKKSQENKFEKMIHFAQSLPDIRGKIARDMQGEELDKDKITATVIWLLEHTLIRIGNQEYAKENDSFGLTTLRNRHVKVHGRDVVFDFRGKSGVEHTVSISNPKIAKIIKECFELPGYEIFRYMDEDEKRTIDSQNVNEYLQKITNEDITAKEFRTWGGTVLGGATLFAIGPAENEKMVKHNIAAAVKKVAQHLRNTVKVCRTYYIHPVILTTYERHQLVPHFEKEYKNFDKSKTKLSRPEFATLTLLQKYS